MAKFNDFVAIVQHYNPHIVLLSETWLHKEIPDELVNVQGYTLFRSDRTTSRGGGVCVYIRNCKTDVFCVQVYPTHCQNIDTIAVDISCNDFLLTVMCVYRPPHTPLEDGNMLCEQIAALSSRKNFILAGDFNFPDLKWPLAFSAVAENASSGFADFILNSHLTQLVNEPTRYRLNQEPSQLDLLFTSDVNLCFSPDICAPVGKSDHCLLKTNIQFCLQHSKCKSNFRYIKVTNFEEVSNHLSQINWNYLLGDADVDTMWNQFHTTVLNAIDTYTCEKKIYTNKLKPWITADILRQIKTKKAMWKRYVRSVSTEDYYNHRRFSNSLSQTIKNARICYENSLAGSGCMKKFISTLDPRSTPKWGCLYCDTQTEIFVKMKMK